MGSIPNSIRSRSRRFIRLLMAVLAGAFSTACILLEPFVLDPSPASSRLYDPEQEEAARYLIQHPDEMDLQVVSAPVKVKRFTPFEMTLRLRNRSPYARGFVFRCDGWGLLEGMNTDSFAIQPPPDRLIICDGDPTLSLPP